MTAILIGTGPCWTLSHEIHWESWRHFDSELDALIALARDIERTINFFRIARPGADRKTTTEILASDDLAYLTDSTFDRGPAQCARIRCNGCGVEADWEEGTTSTEGDHFLVDDLAFLADWGWMSAGAWDSCPNCPVPEEAVRAHEEELARRPGPNDVPLFEVLDPGDGS